MVTTQEREPLADGEFEVRAIREEERQECLDLWCTVWPGDTSDYFRRYFYGDREFLPYYTRVGVLNGKIVSAVQICKRVVACGEQLLTMGGIANVSTLPEYRGHGFNTACLKSAISVMEADAMDFSLLFTGIQPYYERQGFGVIDKRWVSGTIREDYMPSGGPYQVRNATVEDLEAIQTCYDQYNRKRPITVQRYPAYWRDWINIHAQHIPDTLLVATDSDERVVGYVQTGVFKSAVPYSSDGAKVRVIEYGTVDFGLNPMGSPHHPDRQLASALLNGVVERLDPNIPRVLRLEIALEPDLLEVFRGMVVSVEEHSNVSGMVRLLHRDNLCRSMSMVWNERWFAAGRPEGRLQIETPYGCTMVDATGNLIRISTDERADADVILLPQQTFLALLFGWMSAEQVTTDENLRPLLASLFPPQACVYYGADGF